MIKLNEVNTKQQHIGCRGRTLGDPQAITLIALVITIVILIILAGVAINLTVGENGLLNKAKLAKQEYNNAVTSEEEQLNELYAYLTRDDLPENTKENPQAIGTLVKLPSNWETTLPNYVSLSDGSIVTKSTKVASVYAVSVGNGNTVPIPVGFHYVGGTLDTGVVISDKYEDSYENNKRDMTGHSDAINLIGNQFVWIPCEAEEYHKYDVWNNQTQVNGTLADGMWDKTTPAAEIMQIKKYNGFYVGRYEAGIAEGMDETSIPTVDLYNIEGIPQSKANKIPWSCIDWNTTKKNAQSMYSTNNNVESGLITGTQWDTMLKIMVKKGAITEENTVNPTDWGNCADTSVSYQGRTLTSTGNWTITTGYTTDIQSGTTTINSNGTGIVFSTGSSEQCKRYNIYDIAGNMFEMTDEISVYNNDANNVHIYIRGGGGCNIFKNSYSNNICSRYSRDSTTTSGQSFLSGFRVVLYMK